MGLSFGEIVVLAVLALVVIGPKDLPKILRAAGRLIGQAKRVVSDVRRETGLDEVLRGDFRDLERLADHIESLEPYRGDDDKAAAKVPWTAVREREYPLVGADASGLLPDDAEVYLHEHDRYDGNDHNGPEGDEAHTIDVPESSKAETSSADVEAAATPPPNEGVTT